MNDTQGSPAEHMTTRLTMDSFEVMALSSLRLFFGSYCGIQSSAYELSLREARSRLGPTGGPMFVAFVSDFVAGIRNTRINGFSFLSVGCDACQSNLTHDECAAMRVVQAARSREMSTLVQEIETLLAGSSEQEPVFDAALALADFMNQTVQNANDKYRSSTVQAEDFPDLETRSGRLLH